MRPMSPGSIRCGVKMDGGMCYQRNGSGGKLQRLRSHLQRSTPYGQHSLLRWDPTNCHATWWTLDSLASNRLLDPFLACFSKASSLARQRIVISTGLHHGASEALTASPRGHRRFIEYVRLLRDLFCPKFVLQHTKHTMLFVGHSTR